MVADLAVNKLEDLEMATQQRQQQDFRAGQQHLAYLQQDSAHRLQHLVPPLLQHLDPRQHQHLARRPR